MGFAESESCSVRKLQRLGIVLFGRCSLWEAIYGGDGVWDWQCVRGGFGVIGCCGVWELWCLGVVVLGSAPMWELVLHPITVTGMLNIFYFFPFFEFFCFNIFRYNVIFHANLAKKATNNAAFRVACTRLKTC